MRRLLTAFVLTLLCAVGQAQFQGLVVNEFSQGTFGTKEFFEFVVVGNKNCTDSTADIRGWVFDDNNGWYGTGPGQGISQGHYRFASNANWQKVPFGSIILVYNDADKNTNIVLTDDPTDANGDNVYVVPISSIYLEDNPTPAAGSTNPTFSYAGATYTGNSNSWARTGLSNSGDAVIVVNPGNPGTAFFSILFGLTNTGLQTPTITKPSVGATNNCYLADANYSTPGSWLVGTAGTSVETPGGGNTAANTTWINSMRLGRPKIALTTSSFSVCFSANQQTISLPYNWTWYAPNQYSITWDAAAMAAGFIAVPNTTLPAGSIPVTVPGGTASGTYTGYLTVTNSNGNSCQPVPFSITINAPPIVSAGSYAPICINNGPITLAGTPVGGTFSGPGVIGSVFTPPGVGSYAIQYSYTDANGCANSANTNIVVNAQPTITVSPNSPLICSNGTGVVLTAGGGTSYTWNPSTGLSATTGATVTASPTSNQTYTVTGTDGNGCSNSAIANVTVSSAPTTPTYLLFSPTCVQPGGITITAPQGTGLTYSIDGVSYFNNGGVFSNVAPGNYTLSVSNSDGCVSTSVPVTVPPPPGAPAAPTVSVTQTTCNGNTGSILVTSPAQGTGYEYSINNVTWVSTTLFSNLPPGNYQVWVRNTATGCSSNGTAVTINPQPVTPTVSVNSATICPNTATTITATPTPAGTYTYVWTVPSGATNPGNVPSFTATIAGSYSVHATNAAGCSGSGSGTLTVTALPIITADNKQVCENGSVILTGTPSGGTWSGTNVSGNLFNATGLTPGNYTVTYSYTSDGCTASAIATVTVNAIPASPAYQITAATCVQNGSIAVLSPVGGGFTYSLDGVNYIANGGLFTNVPVGSYSLSVKNAAGCVSASVVVNITDPVPPGTPTFLVAQPTCSVSTGTITVTSPAAGTGYSYSLNGTTWVSTAVFSNLAPGTYTVFIRDNATGCVGTPAPVTINAVTVPVAPSVNTTQPTCTIGTGTITVTAPLGIGLQYSIDGSTYVTSTTFTGLAPNTYTVTVRNNSGCVSQGTISVINAIPSGPGTPTYTITQPSCVISTGSILVTSPIGAGLVYSIDGTNYQASTTFTGLAAGTYTLWVRNSSGCLGSASVVINAAPGTPPVPTVNIVQPNCNIPTGSISITSPLGLSYSIDGVAYQSATSFIGLAPGTYQVTVRNAAGCISGAQTAVINPAPPAPVPPSVNVIQPTCTIVTGTISVTSPTGAGYSYNINGGAYQSTSSFTGLVPGTYTIGVQNSDGCTSAPISVTINAAPAVPMAPTVIVSQPTCTTPTGSIAITAPTGSGLEYSIDGVSFVSTAVFVGLLPNAYTVQVRNSNGCISASTTAVINAAPGVPNIPVLNVSQPTCVVSTGTIIVSSPIGAGIEYSIDGVNFSTSGSFTGLAPGNYTITVRNAQGCSSTSTATINTAPTTPTTPAVTITQPTCTQTTGGITITSPLGTGLSYSINGVTYQISTSFAGLLPGTYTVTVQNANGCSSSTTAMVNAPPPTPATPTLTVVQPTCNTSTGTITVTAPTGAGIEYSIDAINFQNSNSFIGLAPNTYTVLVRNASGCMSNSTSVTINAPPTTPAVTVNSPVICPGSNATIVATPSAAGTYTYVWAVPAGLPNPGNVASFSTNMAGTYTVTITNAAGCSGSGTGTLTITPLAAVSADDKQVCIGATVMLTGQPTGGTWSGANVTGNTFNAAGLSAGNYTVTYSYSSGSCSGSANATITVVSFPADPVVNTTQPNCVNSTGNINITSPTGAGYSYSINGGSSYQTLANFAGLVPGNYAVTVMNSNGCVSSVVQVVIQPQPVTPAMPTVAVTQPTCTNPTGSLNVLSPIGAGLEYSIDGITYQSNTAFSNLSPGSYNITVRSSSGCISSAYSFIVNPVPTPPNAPTVSVSQPDCLVTHGTITINSPISTGLNYSIDGIDYSNTTGVFSNLSPGTYNVTVRNSAGCISGVTVAVVNAVPAPPAVSVNSPVICPGAIATITATAAPAGPYTYVWSVPVGAINPGNVASFTTNISGVYSVTVTQPNGCASSGSGTVTINAVANVTADDKQVCAGSIVALTGQPSGGTWSGPNVIGNQFNAAGLPAGTYSVTYTYSSGSCSGTANATITVSALPSAPGIAVVNNCNGTSTLTASNYTGNLTWSNGTTTNPIVVTSAGNYTVFQTINGCNSSLASATANPGQTPQAPIVVITQQPTCTISTGSISVSSPIGAGLSYSIDGVNYNNTSGLFSGLLPGTYLVTVRNGVCTSAPTPVTIATAPSVPATPTVQTVQPNCSVNTGTITITSPNGTGIEYSLDGINYQPSNVFNNLPAGSYGVRVRNSSGCVSAIATTTLVAAAGSITTSATACIVEGSSYSFNGQVLTQSGNYTTTYPRPGQCDSIVNLYLLVSRTVVDHYSGCGSYNYNGTVYTNSTVVRDTISSVVTGCDSLYHVVNITVNAEPVSRISACLSTGQSYNFNGQVLTASGLYSAVFSSAAGCDSTVFLRLVVTRNETVQVRGCTIVTYNGLTYTSNTILTEIIPSTITSCDSVIRTVNIVVEPKPVIVVSSNRTICRGDSITLSASANNTSIEWIGFGINATIKVAPQNTTIYTAVATNAAGCTDTARVTITVNGFDAHLVAISNTVIAGTIVQLSTTANTSYQVLKWEPFNTTGGFVKSFIADTSLMVKVITRSSDGCVDMDSLHIIVDPLDGIYIPTAFTPNRDGKNDLFTIAGGDFKTFDLKIFNRWGQMIFSTQQRSKGWDGTFAGKEQPNGAYVYVLSATLKDGRRINRRGTITLIK